jgi:hypothetical protein
MFEQFRADYNAARRETQAWAKNQKIAWAVLVVAIIVVRRVAEYFSIPWYDIVGLEMILVVIPGFEWVRRRSMRRNSP